MWIVITNSLDNTVRRLNRQTLNHHPESRHLALNIHLMSYLNPPAVSAFYQSYCYYQ